jgi:hypothetical protein
MLQREAVHVDERCQRKGHQGYEQRRYTGTNHKAKTGEASTAHSRDQMRNEFLNLARNFPVAEKNLHPGGPFGKDLAKRVRNS